MSSEKKILISMDESNNIPSSFSVVLYKDIETLEDESLDELFLSNLLDSFKDSEIIGAFGEVFSKVSVRGKIHIQSIDIDQFCLYFSSRILEFDEKNILYSGQKNIQSMAVLLNIIDKHFPCQVLAKKYVNGYEYYLLLEKK